MGNLRILIADDSLIILKKLAKLFQELGHTVVETVRTGSDAVAKYDPERIDLVSMDITMPDMDGIEATKHILEKDPSAKVMMVTSHGQEQMIVEAINAGALGYILKPFNSQKISTMIEKIIASDSAGA